MPEDKKYAYDVWKMPTGAKRKALLKRLALPVAVVLVVCVVLVIAYAGNNEDAAPNETNHPDDEVAQRVPADDVGPDPGDEPKSFVQPGKPVKLVRIADAQSVVVRDGDDTYRVVLAGIESPRVGQPGYREAVAALKKLAPLDASTVMIERDSLLGDKDRYGKPLRYLWVDGVNVNVRMVRRGHARYAGRSKHDADFRD